VGFSLDPLWLASFWLWWGVFLSPQLFIISGFYRTISMARVNGFPGCCSVNVLHRFSDGITAKDDYGYYRPQLDNGSGRFVSIIGDHQKVAYDALCKKYILESQSHPFMGNHGRKLIVCVFKIKKDKK
jgi:hypothetical protein